MPFNLPNILTILRLLAAPLVGLVFVVFASPLADVIALVLFVAAAVTDWLDGRIARARGQVSAFGAMLDPIADKAMVVIALAILLGLWQGYWLIVLPVVAILFREVAVSGLREYLGAEKGLLQVTPLAKWKTTVQMVAIGVLLGAGIFQSQVGALYYSMSPEEYDAVLEGVAEDRYGLVLVNWLSNWGTGAGLVLLWLAAVLTLITGWDYFAKALPVLARKEKQG